MSELESKLTSRKFWVAVAAALASIGTSIGGIATDNANIVCFGVVCLIISQAIYSFCEAYVDGASIKANTTTTMVTASTASTINAVKKDSSAPAASASSTKEEASNA